MPQKKDSRQGVGAVDKIAQGRSLPHSGEAEANLLGCILTDAELSLDILNRLTQEHFYLNSHKTIFSAMQSLASRNVPIDLITLIDELERMSALAQVGGLDYLTKVQDSVISGAGYKVYFDIVERNFVLRTLIRTCGGIIERAYVEQNHEQLIADAEKDVYDINRGKMSKTITGISDSIGEVLKRFDAAHRNKGAYTGVTSGIRRLDSKTRGFQKGNLIILAATTGMGKTSFALNIAQNAAKEGRSIAIFSLEMSSAEIAQRFICSYAGIDMSKAMRGDLTENDWVKINDATNYLSTLSVFIDDSSITTPNEILAKCRRIQARHGLDLVIIDYLQLMTMGENRPSESRQREVSEISRNLKIMAKELSLPVLALSQLSREADKRKQKEGKEPALSDLRESGAIEQDADMVIFIHKPEVEEEERNELEVDAKIIIAKHRNGPLDDIPVKWLPQIVTFVNDEEDAKRLIETGGGKIKAKSAGGGGEDIPLPSEEPPIEDMLPVDDEELGGLGY